MDQIISEARIQPDSSPENVAVTAMQPSWTRLFKQYIIQHAGRACRDVSTFGNIATTFSESSLFTSKLRKNTFVTIEAYRRPNDFYLSIQDVADVVAMGCSCDVGEVNAIDALVGLQLGIARIADYFGLPTWPMLIKGERTHLKFNSTVSYLVGRSLFRQIALVTVIGTQIPTVHAQLTGPGAVVQTITTQLSQNAVILCFGVILGSGKTQSALGHAAAGPLTAVSAVVWSCNLLLRKAKGRLMDKDDEFYSLEFNTFSDDYDGPESNWVMFLLMAFGPWVLAILGVLNNIHTDINFTWYIVACCAFAVAEIMRVLAMFTTYKGTHSEFCINDHNYYTTEIYRPWEEIPRIAEVTARQINIVKGWAQLATHPVDIDKVKGNASLYQRWSHPLYAVVTVAMCLTSATAALTHMASIVLSGAEDVLTGLWCLLISVLAAGLYDPLKYELVQQEKELVHRAKQAAAVALCIPEISSWPDTVPFRRWVYYSILFPGEQIKLGRGEKKLHEMPRVGKEIDLHRLMSIYAKNDKALVRICRHQEYNGNSTWFEIADYMHTTALYFVKHSAMCNSGHAVEWPGVCKADISNISLTTLAVAGHTSCEGVKEVLDLIRSFFDLRVYQYVLADAVGLEQIALHEVRDKIRSTNPATAASHAIMMQWFGDIAEVDDRRETLLIMAYLLGGTSVLGMALSRVLEVAYTAHGGAVAEVGPGILKMMVAEITLNVKVAMHKWPSLCPPQINETEAVDQPYLYAFILMSMLRPAKALPSTREESRIEEIIDDLQVHAE